MNALWLRFVLIVAWCVAMTSGALTGLAYGLSTISGALLAYVERRIG